MGQSSPPNALLLVAIFAAACDLTPDDRYVGALGLPPFYVVSSSLEPGTPDAPLNQPIRLGFSRYLDPDSFEYYNAVTVQSGGLGTSGFTRYRLTDRTLTFYPTRNLRPGLIYTVTVNPETVRALGGDPLSSPFSMSFQTSTGGTVPQDRDVPLRSFAADVAPVLAASCSCHGVTAELPALDRAALVGRPSTELPDRLLVRPWDAPRSYLMHKILPDYPDRRFVEMPPPWSDQPPLAAEDLAIIEDWINTGAEP